MTQIQKCLLTLFLALGLSSQLYAQTPLNVELYSRTPSSDILFGIGYNDAELFYSYNFVAHPIGKNKWLDSYYQMDSTVSMIERFNTQTKKKDSILIKSSLDSIFKCTSYMAQYNNGKYYFTYSKIDSARFFKGYSNSRSSYLFTIDSSFTDLEIHRLGVEFGDSALYYNRNFLVDDDYSYHLWFFTGDSSTPVYLVKNDLGTGAMVDSVFLPPNIYINSDNIYHLAWLDDSTLVTYGDLTSIIHTGTMTIDTSSYPDPDSYNGLLGNFGIILSSIEYNPNDSTMNFFSYVYSDSLSLHTVDVYGRIRRKNITNTHVLPGWGTPTYFFAAGNHFRYGNYNYLLHASKDLMSELILCFDEQGEVRWYKIFENPQDSILEVSLQGTIDSGLIAYMMMKSPDSTDIDCYILKLDKDGDQEIDWLLSTDDTERIALRDALLLYPNPTRQTLHLANQNLYNNKATIQIYDALGAVLLKQDFSPEVDVSGLPPGAYIYTYHPEEGDVLSAPFVVE